MEPFFEALEIEQAGEIEQLARVMYEARENRRMILDQYQTDDPGEVLTRVTAQCNAGESGHPGYEHYLAVRILDDTRNAARSLMAARLKDASIPDAAPAPAHLGLQDKLDVLASGRLASAPQLHQDALILNLSNGVELTAHFASSTEYSLRWRTAEGDELGIDTAPGHSGLDTGPHHLHLPDGRIVDDPLTRPGLPPADNLRAVIDALHQDPLLSTLR